MKDKEIINNVLNNLKGSFSIVTSKNKVIHLAKKDIEIPLIQAISLTIKECRITTVCVCGHKDNQHGWGSCDVIECTCKNFNELKKQVKT